MSRYDDIIHTPYPFPHGHKRMSLENRAAQFAPFAALNTYESTLQETRRVTNEKIELDNTQKELLDYRIQSLLQNNFEEQIVHFIYFVHDKHKKGGSYQEITGIIKAIDLVKQEIILLDNTKLIMDDIYDIIL